MTRLIALLLFLLACTTFYFIYNNVDYPFLRKEVQSTVVDYTDGIVYVKSVNGPYRLSTSKLKTQSINYAPGDYIVYYATNNWWNALVILNIILFFAFLFLIGGGQLLMMMVEAL